MHKNYFPQIFLKKIVPGPHNLLNGIVYVKNNRFVK